MILLTSIKPDSWQKASFRNLDVIILRPLVQFLNPSRSGSSCVLHYQKNWPLRQLDVNNAFLHDTLHEDVFMIQPLGYIYPQFPNHILKLRKALYGLKQAPHAWHQVINKRFGYFTSVLGVEVIFTPSGLFLSQHRHIADLLSRFNMVGSKEVLTPLSSKETLLLNDGSPTVDSSSYRSIVGSLQYLAITHPDVSFVVNNLSQFMHAPTQLHL
ncbi:retrovirus-related pol polyprotein from transposon RE2 [Tanacetum coccineum]